MTRDMLSAKMVDCVNGQTNGVRRCRKSAVDGRWQKKMTLSALIENEWVGPGVAGRKEMHEKCYAALVDSLT